MGCLSKRAYGEAGRSGLLRVHRCYEEFWDKADCRLKVQGTRMRHDCRRVDTAIRYPSQDRNRRSKDEALGSGEMKMAGNKKCSANE
jgi:hypothetical protein